MRLARSLALALDATALASQVGIKKLEPWQKKALRSTAKNMLFCCSRGAGKSTVAALLALHEVLYKPGSKVVVVSPSRDQSRELFRRAVDFYQSIDRPVTAEIENRLELELSNKSRLIAMPGNETTTRGIQGVSLLIVDEAARVPDEVWYAVRFTTATAQGRIVVMSTPFGKRGWFYDLHQAEESTWERFMVPVYDIAHISPSEVEAAKKEMPAWVFAQEMECKFMDPATAAFNVDDIEAAFDESIDEWEIELQGVEA